MADINDYVLELAKAAKAASRPLGFASDEARCAAVHAMAAALGCHGVRGTPQRDG